MKDENTTKRKASFLPDRRNKYSIRKFTVGTASILVGASLLFGIETQDAQAAEQSTTSTENAATPDKDTEVEVKDADAVVNETAKPTSSEVVKTDEVQEVSKTKVETPQATENEVSTEKTAPKEEAVTPNQQVVSTEKTTVENKVEVKQVVEAPKVELPQSTLEVQQVQDLNTAAEFYAQSSGVSIDEAQALIQGLNLDSHATPEEIQQALIYQLSHEYETWFKPAVREDLTTEAEHVADNPDFVKYAATLPNGPEVIQADAIKNGYVRSGSDEINKANLISGRAWITTTGTLATGSNGLLPVPQNTPVFLQWKDKDGSVSPIYVAYTHNNKNDDAAQDGPGAYAFDLRKGWTDASGKKHLFTANEGQEYRFWIEDFRTPEGNTATMLRQAGGFFPGAFVNSFTNSNLGQTPVVGKNVSRTGIYMSVIPSSHYMTKATNQWSTSNARPGDTGVLAIDGMNTVRGKVWLESSGGDRANSATGPAYNPNIGDKVASNYHVVFSTLTASGASAYKQQVERLPVNQRPAAAKRLLSQHPEYIASTVQATTDSRGAYAIKFPTGMQMDYLYGFITDPKGNLVQAYSAFTSPEFRKPNSAPSISAQAIPYPGVQQWANVNFAVVTSPSQAPKLEITNFNTTTQPAAPGNKALIKLDGKTIPALPTHIEWTNGNGQVVHRTREFHTIGEGQKLGEFTIPAGAKDGEIYTALLVSGGNVISGDSLIVHKAQSTKYPPKATEINKPFGEAATPDEVINHVTFPGLPANTKAPNVTVDHPDQIPNGQTPGRVEVPVTVTYADGSVAHINVPVITGKQADKDKYTPTAGSIEKEFGQKATPDEVKGKVTVPNFPANGDQPTFTVDENSIPDGQTPGTVNVPVTVHYPDGTEENIDVPVTTKDQPQKDKYQPTTGEITKPYGTPTTEDEVKGKVKVPNFPTTGDQPRFTVDTTKVPDGQTPGEFQVPVTVTYPDNTTDIVNVKVTVGPKNSVTYEPTAGEITKPFGTPTTEAEVKGKVTVPNFPTTGAQPTFTVDTTKVPDGQTSGEFQVPVTVTYPDKTTDTVNVKVTVGPKDSVTYEPTAGEITKPYGTPTTEDEVKGKVTVPNFPKTGDQPRFTVDTTKVPDGQTSGEFQVPVTVTYPDKTTDTVNVKVTVGPKDSVTYEPTAGEITKPFGTPTTEDEVKGKVSVPNFPTTGDQPVIAVDDPTKVPDGQTPGEFDVPVTVTYPDGTKDKVTVKVTVGEQPQKDKYEPTTGEITKPFGTPTTEDEVKGKVTVPNFPTTGDQPRFTVDTTKVPDGQTPGEFQVPVTVTYPDNTTDTVNVKVTVSPQPQNDKYEPTTEAITKPFGTPTTEDEVKGKVSVPDFPAGGDQPVITVDDPTKVPNGQTPGEFDVPVTVTYPDGTKDKVNVKVTVGEQPQKDKYEPTTGEITKPFGTPTTEDEVKGKVTVPNFPTTGDQPRFTVDTTKVPDGQTPGEFQVPVTVTYPDNTTDTVNVKVTVSPQPQNDKYEPTTGEITKPYGTPTTEDEVKGKVTVPNFPATGDQPVITVDDPTKVPNGQTPGEYDVPVTVTYPDGTKDKVTVKVTVSPQPQNEKYEPTTGEITKPFGTPTGEDEVKGKVTVPNFPAGGDQPVIAVDDPTKVPDGQTPGEYDVPVTVTYPDGTKDKVNVKVTVTPQPQNDKYEPTTGEITKPFGTPTTEDEVKGKVTVPNFPAGGDQPVIAVDDPTKVPDGQTPGEYDVPVTVTYPDGTKDKVNVKVTVTPQPQNDKYEPTTGEITKPFGTPTTEDEVKGKVSVPNFPADGDQPVITVEDPTKVPDGQTPGEYDVPVTVTYPDGTKDKVNVKVTVSPQPQNEKYEPTTGEITKPFGTPTGEDEVKGKVTVPNFPAGGDQPVITVDTTKIPDGQTSGEFEVPVTVTYPDKTTDTVNVKVTVGPKDSETYEPKFENITKTFGTPTTEEEVKGKVTVPNFPTTGNQPVITVDDPTKVPDGQTTGVFDVPVTVTYPDGTKDKVTVKVTVGEQPDNLKYDPTTGEITKPFGATTTPDEVKDKVTVPGYPENGQPYTVTVDETKIPDGQTSGEFEVPTTVTYPDNTTDTVNVKVTVGPKNSETYEPTVQPIEKPFGTPTTEEEVKGKVTIPNFPTTGDQPVITVDDPTKVPNGQTPGEFDVPVTVTYPDGTKDKVNVKVTVTPQPQNDKYEPTTEAITKPFGTPTSEDEVKGKVTVPNFPADGDQPVISVDDPTKVPDGQTPGEFDVPVTVTYPDGTKDKVTVKVTVGDQADNAKYEPTTEAITKPFGTPTTEDEVKGKVTIPNFPTTGDQPVISVDDPTKVPNGQTPGEFDVPVTVTYPDGTKDKVTVKVTVGDQADNAKYEPTTEAITKPFGTPTTEDEVKGKVTVPNFPTTGDQPRFTVDTTKVPDGQTPGEFQVPVTVTYPDNTTDTVNVKVTVGEQPQKDKYEPTTEAITKPFGTPTTEDEVKGKVSVPDFPAGGDQPVITVDDPTKVPNGQTPGEFDVPVTVTYPDGTKDKVNVKVTVGEQPQKDKYEPKFENITKPFGQGTTKDEVKGKVTVPNFPAGGDQPVITVDDPTKIPDGQTTGVFDVPVTVTYPDGTKDKVTVKVTVGEQPDNLKYDPTASEITKHYGEKTTPEEVKGKVTVPGYPENGQPYTVTIDETKIPDGQTPGEFEVPTTVTYPDNTTDTVNVKVTVGPKDSDTYEPTVQPIEKPFGTPTTEDEVKGKVTVPNFPTTGDQPVVTVDDPTKVPNGQTTGVFDVPVTVTYPDGTKDKVTVKVTVGDQADNAKYEPTTEAITKPFGTATTEDEVKGKVTIPNFPTTGDQPVVTVDDPTKVPNGQTTGVFDVPVTVTYPDGTKDKVTVKVTVGDQADNAKYEPTTEPITKPFGQGTTEDEVKDKVKVPNFPTTGDQPVITVDDPTKVPDGQTPGEYDVPVTVTYPDGTKDHVTVKVTVNPQPQNDKYEPTTEPITKPFGQGTTEDEVKDKVKVPNFPTTGDQPVITVDDPTKVPDGQTPGEYDVPVTVTYPDGTKDHVTVKVTVNPQPQNDKYEPTTEPITKPFGQGTTEDEVKDKVKVPNFPTTGDQPVITVDDPTKVPDGQTPGEYDVPVTVTYPDGTKDHVTVKVTVNPQPQNDKYEPTTEPITKPFGQGTTEDEVKDKVKVPNFPTDKGTPVVTVDDPTKIPDGQTPGEYDVPVTVTYPDGTKDKVTVKVTVGPKDSDTYEPTVQPIEKPFGQGTTEQEVKDKVTVPNFPTDKGTPVVTVDDPTKIPNGQTPGEYDVPVTVTYPDGTKDHVTVKVTVNPQPQNDKYEPTTEAITKPFGTPTTEDEVKGKVTIPNFPTTGDQPVITVDDPTKVPNGQTPGEYDVPVTVTYPDGTKDKVTVKVTVNPQPQNDKYEPTTEPITKPFGQGTTEDEVKDKVKVPNFPTTGDQPVITVDDPTKVPDGQTPGEYDVPVTVTYPDGTKDHVTVKVTVNPQPQNDKYEPTTEPITKPFGQGTTEDEVKGKVTIPNFPTTGDQPVITVDDPTKVPDGQTPGEYDVPVTVTYPDGTKDKVTVKVTVGPKDSDVFEPVTETVEKPYGTPVTIDDVVSKVTVPGYSKVDEPYKVTVDDPTKIPNGQTPGVYDVPVTVTYPDGSTDHVIVKVVVGPKDSDTYEPTVQPIEKPFGQGTTEQEVKDKVKVPNFPTDKGTPVVTVDDPTKIPNGQTPGVYDVPVKVTYPDGSTDHVIVKVVVGPKDSDIYEPTAQPIEKPFGTPTTVDEVVSKVTVPGYSETEKPYKVTVDDPSLIPDGQTPGEYDVPVTVTYPDGTKDYINVTITVHPQPDTDVYNPGYNDVEVNPGESIEIPQVKDDVPTGTRFEIPETSGVDKDWKVAVDPNTGTITVTSPKDAAEGDVVTVTVTVTYPDGSTEDVTVNVTVHDSIAPEAPVVNPIEAGDRTVTGTGKEPGTTVTVTFPDGSTVSTKVDEEGNWKVDVPSTVTLKVGDTVKAVITDEAGNVSEETVTPVKDTVAPDAPVVNGIHTGDKVITGTAEPGTTVKVTFPNGTTVSVKVGQDGTWSVDVPSDVTLRTGDKVTAVAIDEAGNVSKSTTAIVVGDKDSNPTPNNNHTKVPTKHVDTNRPSTKDEVSKAKDTSSNKAAKKSTAKSLPETGEDTTNSGVLFGGLFATLGAFLLFRRRRNHDDNK
ncbi:Rib/alpha-like domain-containing protein [Staphylococcus simulans]